MLCCLRKSVGALIQEWPVNLIGISQQNNLCIFPRTGDDSFDLIWGSILCFVDNQIRLNQGTATDKVQSFGLDQLPPKNLFYLPF